MGRSPGSTMLAEDLVGHWTWPSRCGQLTPALSRQDRPGTSKCQQGSSMGGPHRRTPWADPPARPQAPPSHLFAPTIEGFLHLPSGLGHVAFLQKGKIVRVLEGNFELPILSFFQRVEEILREPSCGNKIREAFKHQHTDKAGGVGWEWESAKFSLPSTLCDSSHSPPALNPKGKTSKTL